MLISAFEAMVAAETDIFCRVDFLSAFFSCIQQPANRCHRYEYQDDRMKLEKQKKQKRPADQNKDNHQNDPERIIALVIPLSRCNFFGSAMGASHYSVIPIESIRENKEKSKDFIKKSSFKSLIIKGSGIPSRNYRQRCT